MYFESCRVTGSERSTAVPLYIQKLGTQFVGWNFVLLEAMCQQENMTDGQTVRFSMLYIQWAWLESSEGGGDAVKLT
jgi:hypothetical protein